MSTVKDEAIKLRQNIDAVYEAGQKAEYNRFWDTLQNYGAKELYSGTFQKPSWNDENFKPKYDIYPTTNTFTSGEDPAFIKCKITDLREETLGIKVDWSLCTNFNVIFMSTPIRYADIIDMTNAIYGGTIFYGSKIEYVQKLILPTMPMTFHNSGLAASASLLKEIRFEGYFQRNFGLFNKYLTLDSLKSAILALKDYSGTSEEYAYTITLSSTYKTMLEADGATSPNGNGWLEYAADKGWNVA